MTTLSKTCKITIEKELNPEIEDLWHQTNALLNEHHVKRIIDQVACDNDLQSFALIYGNKTVQRLLRNALRDLREYFKAKGTKLPKPDPQ